jgi:hypothetical protein
MNDLDSRLRAWNPVRDEDVANAADSAAAATLLQRVLDQPVTGPGRYRSTRHRRWALAGVAAVAAAAVLVAIALQGPSAPRATGHHHPAPDMHLVDFTVRHGDIVARITDPDAAASQLSAVFRAYGLNITVKAVPVSPSLVGTITFSDQVPAVRTLWKPACAGGCPVGLIIPANFKGSGNIVVGRAAKPGEKYGTMSDSFAPGEALHCSGLAGQPASAALPVLRKLGLHASWWALAPNGTGHFARTPSGYITDGTPISATQVSLDVQPTPPHGRQFRTEVAQDNRGCQ